MTPLALAQSTYLRAKRSLFVKMTLNEITVFSCGYWTSPVDTDTTRMSDNLAGHVFCKCHFMSSILLPVSLWYRDGLPTNRPFRDIVRPFVWSYRCRSFAKPKIIEKHFFKKNFILTFLLKKLKNLTYFGSKPQTEPEILPPGPESPADHFFHVDIDFC